MLETLDYTIRIGSTPTILYFHFYLYSAYAAHYVYIYIYIGSTCTNYKLYILICISTLPTHAAHAQRSMFRKRLSKRQDIS